jgi:hypothetical protein
MPAPSTDVGPALSPEELEDLILQVHDLQQRVLNLEKRLGSAVASETLPVAETPPAAAVAELAPDLDLPSNTVPVLGRMLVAIAGAYVLRALTEWSVLPPAAGVAIGLLYALVWLWIAARSPASSRFAAAVSCSTSVFIMVPLVWEATERLRVMSSAASAAVLMAFALIALALGSRAPHRIVALIAVSSSILMAFALLLARNDIVPYLTALLLLAAAMELAAWRDRSSGARSLAALAADASVLLFSFLMSAGRGMPETWVPVSLYAVLAAQMALVVIYTGTAVTQTIVRRRTLAFAEMAQTAAALLIGIGGVVWVFKEHRAIMLGLGLAALAAGLACYAVSFLLFERDNKWNFRAWATFGLFLVLAGIFLPFSRFEFWILSCLCALASCWTAKVFHLPTLGLHGAVYLTLGSAVAGATSGPLQLLFAMRGVPPEWWSSVAVLFAAVLSWVAIARISLDGPGRWRNQITSLAIAAHIAWIASGLVVLAVLNIWRTAPPETLGTVVLTALSLSLAWAGTRWGRSELIWLLYAFMALAAYKLAVRDFMNEHNLALVVSLLCYGGALILLPRMLRGSSSSENYGQK